MNEFLSEFRNRRKYYEEHPEEVKRILDEGTAKAREKSKEQLKRVKEAMKIDY